SATPSVDLMSRTLFGLSPDAKRLPTSRSTSPLPIRASFTLASRGPRCLVTAQRCRATVEGLRAPVASEIARVVPAQSSRYAATVVATVFTGWPRLAAISPTAEGGEGVPSLPGAHYAATPPVPNRCSLWPARSALPRRVRLRPARQPRRRA